jgi:hypothetical protein
MSKSSGVEEDMMQIKYGKNYANGVDEELSLSLSVSLKERAVRR